MPGAHLPAWLRIYGALLIFVSGFLICIAGIIEFRRAKTTVDPRIPETTSSLVTSGIYAKTRNPMYVGFTLFLIAWAMYLTSLWSLIIVVAFVVFLNRFQIKPEEEALEVIFGQEFAAYRYRVRRWI
ncbi:hypothetical protein GCM10022278_23990 [Allohahella marinimesophila]|uniref:Protein-S-isoprenylcysteine O-methyltransferase Ste14 n=1 Tax=Allohahella marinimesophila TaxID=1054972 RepID=A0ABP7PI17_9GAMM